jgi:ElaB/YqjD/DUF883 family membrane-anchored ribosome-binding protein
MATVTGAERTTEPCRWPAGQAFEENLREARRAVATVRHAAEDAAVDAELRIRRHPFRAVGAAVVVGAVGGALVGFGAGWLARTRT